MSNTWFRFQQFTIHQDKCGMKVSTDACVFGGIAVEVAAQLPDCTRGLDIGTGTGLLSLMLVQEYGSLYMDAVEIDKDASEQARDNFQQSAWKDRLNVFHTSIQEFVAQAPQQYHLIICNPPFFTNHLVAAEEKRRLARHDATLTHDALLYSIQQLLTVNGLAFLLYPASEEQRVDAALMLTGLKVVQKVYIYPTGNKSYNRVVYFLGQAALVVNYTKEVHIRDCAGGYSDMYERLLGNYALFKK